MVCTVCIKRLEGVHRFAMMAYRTQEKLRLQFYGNVDNTNLVQDEEMQSIKDTQDIAKKVEDRGLLHSILTKVCIACSSTNNNFNVCIYTYIYVT